MKRAEISCADGGHCYEEVTCTPETCEYGQKGWRCVAEHVIHYCAHDFRSGPWIHLPDGGTSSCRCGYTADSHDMRYAP